MMGHHNVNGLAKCRYKFKGKLYLFNEFLQQAHGYCVRYMYYILAKLGQDRLNWVRAGKLGQGRLNWVRARRCQQYEGWTNPWLDSNWPFIHQYHHNELWLCLMPVMLNLGSTHLRQINWCHNQWSKKKWHWCDWSKQSMLYIHILWGDFWK